MPVVPGSSSNIRDYSGGGVLAYTGAIGTDATVTTRQLDTYGAVNPRMEFWYFHDTTLSGTDNSYMEVNVVVD